MLFFKKKKKEPKVVDNSDFKPVNDYDLKPFVDLKYDLIYAHDEILVENDNAIIGARLYKGVTLKFMFLKSLDYINEYSLDKEELVKYAEKKGYFEYIKQEDLLSDKSVEIIIINEKNEKNKEYCFLNAKSTNDLYRQCFIYDDSCNKILEYRKLKDFGPLFEHYQTAIFFDLACVDKEMY